MILLTGGSGVLGRELKKHIKCLAPDRNYLDITKKTYFDALGQIPDLIVHCAAFTSLDRAEKEKELAYNTNVVGTRNLAALESQCYTFQQNTSLTERKEIMKKKMRRTRSTTTLLLNSLGNTNQDELGRWLLGAYLNQDRLNMMLSAMTCSRREITLTESHLKLFSQLKISSNSLLRYISALEERISNHSQEKRSRISRLAELEISEE